MTLPGSRLFWAFWLSASCGAVGCARSSEPRIYTLSSNQGKSFVSAPLRIELRRPELPRYLDRPGLVRRVGSTRLAVASHDIWGAPLEELVGTTLAANLAQRLPKSMVYTEEGGLSAEPDVVVALELHRFELAARGRVELVAQVAVQWPRRDNHVHMSRHTISGHPHGSEADAVVSEMSQLLARLSDMIAHQISRRSG